uniref:ATP synthase F0 subunit 8 n=1 Tax=Rectidens sumatrensis TaxID=1903498 RepID=A0A8A3WMG7_9BIVA|nr:ATP synthase F0 subunit 8 [Rectidens sumatrensis]
MPQFSPMSWLFICFLSVSVLMLMSVELWWLQPNGWFKVKSKKVVGFGERVWGWSNL